MALASATLAAAALVPGAAQAAPVSLRVVTAYLQFAGPVAAGEDWQTIGPNADIVFVQEAKNVVLRDILGDGWIVRQNTSSDDRQGSAVAVRRSAVAEVGDLQLVKGTDASSCGDPPGIMTRWITRTDVKLHNGRWLRVASLHMPPPRCQDGLGSPYAVMADNVVAFVRGGNRLTVLGADWNKVVDDDPNDIGKRADLKPRGPDDTQRIDGFYVSPEIGTADLHLLPRTNSDHRPVQMTISVPSP
jgi:endonuclease/exonuclease/phosphatase family metal-dependent hydrolase